MSVRAKFKVSNIEDGTVYMNPVIGGSPENDVFYRATPGGGITLSVVNPAALAHFEVGESYYVDFTSTEEDARDDELPDYDPDENEDDEETDDSDEEVDEDED